MDDDREKRARELIAAANEAASAVSAGLTSFVGVAVYVVVVLASTSDERLISDTSTLTLPVLNVAIHIGGRLGFCVLAPVLILILHAMLLSQLATVDRRLGAFRAALTGIPKTRRDEIREGLAASYYVRFLARDPGEGNPIVALATVAAMIILPLVVLVGIELRFLPMHDPGTTLFQWLVIVGDVTLALVMLWRPLAGRVTPPAEVARPALAAGVASVWTLGLALCTALLILSVGASLPRRARGARSSLDFSSLDLEAAIFTTDLSAEEINTLRDGTAPEREAILRKVSRSSVLQGRDLRGAKLAGATLPAVDFRARTDRQTGKVVRTAFEDADLSWAQMQQVMLDDANVRHATLQGTGLQGANFARADLEGADLSGAGLEDAKLAAAKLRWAALRDARLTGADLSRADLRDADLSGIHAISAMLREADLRGANLANADLRGADLSRAHLEGTNVAGALLDGAIVDGTMIRDASGAGCKWPHDPTIAMTTPALTLAACRGRPALWTACGETGTVSDLTRMACADGYVARGLAAQIGYDAPGRYALRWALLGVRASEACKGVKLLPDGAHAALERAG